jgi:hypothetical protein
MALAHALPEILKHSCHLAAISGIRLFTLAVVEPPSPNSLSLSTIFTPLPTVTTGPFHGKPGNVFSPYYYI